MPRVLLINTASFGAIVRNFPVLTDIHQALPDTEIDWVVHESLRALPALHPGLSRAIPVSLGGWRHSLLRSDGWAAMRALRETLSASTYDVVIDSEGTFTSALLSRFAMGRKVGLHWRNSGRLLDMFYDASYRITPAMHPVARNRMLSGRALGYALGENLNYGIRANPTLIARDDWYLEAHAKLYCVFIHSASDEAQLWPEHQWSKLGAVIASKGWSVFLPWENNDDQLRSTRLARLIPNAVVPPRLTLDKLATLIAGAKQVVGVDAGLTHLAVALGTPTVAIGPATRSKERGVHELAHSFNVAIGKRGPALVDVVSGLQTLEQRASSNSGQL